jgi:regulator of replication initiation timing
MEALLKQIATLETRLTESRDENEGLKEENALLSLRNKMLVEMLAVSQLDTGRAL